MANTEDIEARFLEAIASDPDSEEARLVYADWLEERGDPRGEFLRLENQLWKIPPRVEELRATIDHDWIAMVSRKVDLYFRSSPNKISTIKLIREVLNIGLKEAVDLVEHAPSLIKVGLSARDAAIYVARFTSTGAVVELRRGDMVVPLPTVVAMAGRSLVVRVVLLPVSASLEGRQREEVVRAIREVTGLGLTEAYSLLRADEGRGPVALREQLVMKDAIEIVARFAALPVTVEILPG